MVTLERKLGHHGHESKYPLLGQNGPKFSTAFSSWQDCLTKPLQDVASRPWQWCRPKRDQEKVENRSRLPQKGSRYPGGDEFIWSFNPLINPFAVATRGKFRASDCGRFEEVAHRPYCFCQHHHPTAVTNPER